MPPVVTDNPIINYPFEEPKRHYRFDENDQLTNVVAEGRRPSTYFLPVAAPKKKPKQLTFESLQDPEKGAESDHVNRIRASLKRWRELGWPDVTSTTRTLLEYWTDLDRPRRLFFCQVEALETPIFITEVTKQTKYGETWSEDHLRKAAEDAATDLFQLACKMATWAGKTVVMSMLIAWQALNKKRNPPTPKPGTKVRAIPERLALRPWLENAFPESSGTGTKYQPSTSGLSSTPPTPSSSPPRISPPSRSTPGSSGRRPNSPWTRRRGCGRRPSRSGSPPNCNRTSTGTAHG